MQREVRAKVPTFHWMTEFPEVFYAERADPLDGDAVNRVAMMDGFVGNPPFAGKNQITEIGGEAYLPWLQAIHVGAHGNADLSAHFFRRASDLLGEHGTIGFIATNTIAQGDTRATGLQRLVVKDGCVIYDAMRSLLWPGAANVAVSVVHLAKGAVAMLALEAKLDGAPVPIISSRLRPKPERPDPVRLAANADQSFQGSIVLGMGFTLTPTERSALVAGDARNGERVFPYLGGEELNSDPEQMFERYVISFGQMTLEESERWPQLLAVVREKVKPERDKLKDNTDGLHRKTHWWQFGRWTPALYAAIAPLGRCLVISRHSKYLLFTFQPVDRIFSEATYVFAFDDYPTFAVLQSRIHEPWARLLSSSMRNDLRYSASDCFETFPFPGPLPESLERSGQALYEARATYMTKHRRGLTETYNRMKDTGESDGEVVELRRLSEAMDREVLGAYGWGDLEVPAFEAAEADAGKGRFEEEVVDRLFALNGERAQKERVLGPTSAARGAPKRGGLKRSTGKAGGGILPGIK